MQKLKFESQSVQKIEWKQTDGQTLPIALPSRLTRCLHMSVCLRPRAYLGNHKSTFTDFLCMLSVAVIRSSFGGVAMR